MGEKYRMECLSHGGGISSRKLIANFLKRDVTPRNLSNSLINEIDTNNEKLRDISKSMNIDCDF